jgi:hypothetical protein
LLSITDPSVTVRLNDIVLTLANLGVNQGKIMATLVEFEAGFARVDAATTAIANLIRDLTAQLAAGGLNAAQEQAIFDRLGLAAGALEAMAVTPTDPVPIDPNA